MAVPSICFVEDGDEHRRNILEHVLRFRALEEGRVLTQFVGHLVDNEATAVRQGFIGFFEQSAFLFNGKDAERNPGKDVVALWDAAPF